MVEPPARLEVIGGRDGAQSHERLASSQTLVAQKPGKPVVSIIVCNYNYEAFVGDAIQSCLDQTYPNVEVIAVDDGSTDNSRGVIERFEGVKKIFKPNGGQTSGVRAGLEVATGEIVMILDSDDLLKPGAVAAIAARYRPQVSLYQFALERVDTAGNDHGRYPRRQFLHKGERDHLLKHGAFPTAPMSGNGFARWYLDIAFETNRDRDDVYLDGYLIFVATLYGEVESCDETLGTYRIHGNNASPVAGANLKRVCNQFSTDYAHRVGLAQHASRLGLSNKTPEDYLTAYQWRQAMMIKRGYPGRPEGAGFTVGEIFGRGVLCFLGNPAIKLSQRVKNVAMLSALAIGPRSLSRKFLPT